MCKSNLEITTSVSLELKKSDLAITNPVQITLNKRKEYTRGKGKDDKILLYENILSRDRLERNQSADLFVSGGFVIDSQSSNLFDYILKKFKVFKDKDGILYLNLNIIYNSSYSKF